MMTRRPILLLSLLYGTMDMAARKLNIGKFRARKAAVLVVTDVAARGIDIPLLDNVINYDFPPRPKLFVHRVGRVARAGRTGVAHSLLVKEEMGFLVDLHLFLGRTLVAASMVPPVSTAEAKVRRCKWKPADTRVEAALSQRLEFKCNEPIS